VFGLFSTFERAKSAWKIFHYAHEFHLFKGALQRLVNFLAGASILQSFRHFGGWRAVSWEQCVWAGVAGILTLFIFRNLLAPAIWLIVERRLLHYVVARNRRRTLTLCGLALAVFAAYATYHLLLGTLPSDAILLHPVPA
jgi:hypothetical protein